MKGIFKLKKTKNGIKIIGLEKESSILITSEDISNAPVQFRPEDLFIYNLIYKVDSKGEKELESSNISQYSCDTCSDSAELQKDGLYKVYHILIPSLDWWKEYIATFSRSEMLKKYEDYIIYVMDSDGNIYKDSKFESLPSDLELEDLLACQSIVEVALNDILEINDIYTTLIRSSLFTFCLDRLEYCYYKLACALLDDICPLDECSTDEDEGWYQLHLIQIERYVIRFLLEKGRYLEAQEVLENLSGCNGPCYSILNNISNNVKSKSGCGCSS